MKRWKLLIALFIFSGCSARDIENPSLEDLAMAGVVGYDVGMEDDNLMRVTTSVLQPSKDAKENVGILSEEDEVSYNAILNIAGDIEKDLNFSQLRVVLFGKEFAEGHEFYEVVKRLYRDPNIGSNVFLAVVDGRADDIISGNYPAKENVNVFLNDLLRPRYRSSFTPFTTIHDFIFSLTSNTGDISMPSIKKEGDTVNINGVALFNNKKIAVVLDVNESKMMQILNHQTNQVSTLQLDIEENGKKEPVVIDFISVKTKVTSHGTLANPKLSFDVRFNGTIIYYKGEYTLSDQKELDIVQNKINQELKRRAEELLAKLIEKQTDPLDFGEQFRKQTRGTWSYEDWKKSYQNMEYSVSFQTNIVSSGTLD